MYIVRTGMDSSDIESGIKSNKDNIIAMDSAVDTVTGIKHRIMRAYNIAMFATLIFGTVIFAMGAHALWIKSNCSINFGDPADTCSNIIGVQVIAGAVMLLTCMISCACALHSFGDACCDSGSGIEEKVRVTNTLTTMSVIAFICGNLFSGSFAWLFYAQFPIAEINASVFVLFGVGISLLFVEAI